MIVFSFKPSRPLITCFISIPLLYFLFDYWVNYVFTYYFIYSLSDILVHLLLAELLNKLPGFPYDLSTDCSLLHQHGDKPYCNIELYPRRYCIIIKYYRHPNQRFFSAPHPNSFRDGNYMVLPQTFSYHIFTMQSFKSYLLDLYSIKFFNSSCISVGAFV